MIVVLDCNIWVSLAINKQFNFITDLSYSGVEIATCQILRDEITDVLFRPKLSKFIDVITAGKVVQIHDLVTKKYKLGKIENVVNDSKDDYLFALCLKAKADFLITGDKLLLKENSYHNTKIISLSSLKGTH